MCILVLCCLRWGHWDAAIPMSLCEVGVILAKLRDLHFIVSSSKGIEPVVQMEKGKTKIV